MRSYPKRESSSRRGIMGFFKKIEILDTYGDEFKFYVNGKKKTKSLLGVVASVLLALFMVYYSYQRVEVMLGYKGTKIL